ncbi:hypothetical protein [Virgisporangium ochraceum]|nr:hypothetical protein [Virgisporangium ochraceum]
MTATLAALAVALDISEISRPYPDRHPSNRTRTYLTATPRGDRKERDQ